MWGSIDREDGDMVAELEVVFYDFERQYVCVHILTFHRHYLYEIVDLRGELKASSLL